MKNFKKTLFQSNKGAHSLLFILSVLLILASCNPKKQEDSKSVKKLNILFLITDQHRGDAIGAAGNTFVITPNMDKLASEGVLFKNAFASIPSCLGARACLLTGMSPWQSGQLGYNKIANYPYEGPALITNAGYRTHVVGKNHFHPKGVAKHGYQTVELDDDCYPMVKKNPDYVKGDYTLFFEKNAPGKDVDATGLGCDDHRGGRIFPYDEYLHPTSWTADRSIHFLKTHNSDTPWFLKVSFHRPHPPLDPFQRWIDEYLKVDMPMPSVGDWAEAQIGHEKGSLEDNGSAIQGVFPKEEVLSSLRSYYAGLSYVDEKIGEILELLRERGELENTLILYTSDHGDMMGDHHMWRKCRPYQGSAQIPMIVRVPKVLNLEIPKGTIRNELVELRDVMPTFLDAAGIEKPDVMDGMSMLDIFRGRKWREILDLEHAKIYKQGISWQALTDGRYKYIYFNLTGGEQLFDMAEDPKELNDLVLAGGHEALIKSWRQKMIDHLQIRGEEWVKDGELVVQTEPIFYGPNHPDYEQLVKN